MERGKKRRYRVGRARHRTSHEQLRRLEEIFAHEKYPSGSFRSLLGRELQMKPKTIQKWFFLSRPHSWSSFVPRVQKKKKDLESRYSNEKTGFRFCRRALRVERGLTFVASRLR